MRIFSTLVFLFGICLLFPAKVKAQLKITAETNAQALVEKLVGTGVTVSNIRLIASPLATGFFNNISGTNIGLDSGIVLTNGRAKTGEGNARGLDGNGTLMAYTGIPANIDSSSTGAFASTDLFRAGDPDLEAILGGVETNDATILEFDFIPLGDTIRFRYVFSSEEYPSFPCQNVNDAFAFFINGPGFPVNTNIALVPGTTAPVTIDNINYLAGCGLYPQFYLSNQKNVNFTHNGHTTIFTAVARVIPCQRYSLKLVIADVLDGVYDSGVFLEAKSLSSNAISLSNTTQVDPQNNSYLVEGCSAGSFKIKRPRAESTSLPVSISYGGTAINGVDMQLLPATVIIPPNQAEVTVNILPIIDNIPEGIETIKVYALAGNSCGNTPTDSTVIQVRDYDTLGINPDTVIICKNSTVQLTATTGYTSYQWDANPTLSNTAIRNPVAFPNTTITTYYCTSTEGTCHGRDSSLVIWKALELVAATGVNCKNGNTGEIKVAGGPAFLRPAQFAINNAPYQNDSTFTNLPVGIYSIKIKDAAGCIDSIVIHIVQLYPDLLINNTAITAASCSGDANGSATVTVTGGNNPYLFSIDGINFQPGNVLHLLRGNYTVTVKDNNSCINTKNIFIPLDNIVTVDVGVDNTICEGKSVQLNAISNADSYNWTPALALSNSMVPNPVASPVQTTKYVVTATQGICTQKDSLFIYVNPAPKANAGNDYTICFGQNAPLNGTGGSSYYWYPSSYLDDARIGSPVAKKLPGSISYFLSVIDDKGCVSLKKDEVVITVTRPALVNAGRDTTIAISQPLQLFAADVNNIGFNQYEWISDYGLSNAHIASPVAILDKSIIYTVVARTAIGCEGTDYITVTVYKGPEIYVPNAFSPNGDNVNDILRATPAGIKAFHYFRIYNRWGNPVFATNDPLTGWDGKLKSVIQTPGTTFVWMAEGIDYKGNLVQRKGTVMIVK
jgi:gliding motility-associated-like protein